MKLERFVNWKVVQRLDNYKVWSMIAYAGLLAVGIWAYSNQHATTSVIAKRKADVAANAAAQYTTCVKSIPILTEFGRFIHGVDEVFLVLVENAIASHQATPHQTAVYRAQIQNLARLRDGVRSVKGLTIPAPTMKKCRALRARLEAQG